MNKYDEEQEQQINALLDGDLNKTEAEKLKAEAGDNRDLANAIVDAYQLQQAMDTVKVERAPASLRRRLGAIPREQKPAFSFMQPRWAMALAAVPLVILTVSLMQPGTPSTDEVARARQDLAIAFAYLDKAGAITGQKIEQSVGDTTADAVTGSVSKAINSPNETSKERKV